MLPTQQPKPRMCVSGLVIFLCILIVRIWFVETVKLNLPGIEIEMALDVNDVNIEWFKDEVKLSSCHAWIMGCTAAWSICMPE